MAKFCGKKLVGARGFEPFKQGLPYTPADWYTRGRGERGRPCDPILLLAGGRRTISPSSTAYKGLDGPPGSQRPLFHLFVLAPVPQTSSLDLEAFGKLRPSWPRSSDTSDSDAMNGSISWIANFIWGIADDVLRDLYVRGKYRDVILAV